jgi:hypothetical protein
VRGKLQGFEVGGLSAAIEDSVLGLLEGGVEVR